MTENAPSQNKLDYRIAVRLFESAFEACERLPDQDQRILLDEIAKRVVTKSRARGGAKGKGDTDRRHRDQFVAITNVLRHL